MIESLSYLAYSFEFLSIEYDYTPAFETYDFFGSKGR